MRVAFYYASFGDYVDKFVAWYTGGPFSHCELVFSDGLCFSSSFRDGGVRYKLIDVSGNHWKLFDIGIDNSRELHIKSWCDQHVGKSYDLVGMIFPLFARNDRWWCSEVNLAALRVENLFMSVDLARSSPNSWYKQCFAGGNFRSI